MRYVHVAIIAVMACQGRTEAQRACDAYARAFAEAAAVRCDRGTVEDNLAAFKAATGVGADCSLVRAIRDLDSLEETCLPWFEDAADDAEGALQCAMLDEREAYLQALPEACRGQLQVVGGSTDTGAN